MKSFVTKFQIGKNKLTEGIINSLNNNLQTHKQVRISVLKSCSRNREETKKIVEQLEKKVKFKCAYRIIGYTIIIIKLK